MVFPQEAVASEVDKSLNRAFQTIRPQSTTVNMQVSSDSPGQEFTLQYTVPAAAWKMTYRLRADGSSISLDGVGVVDNNTEEDWNDFLISMVVGEPVTFSTDVASSKIPQRQQVNLVSQEAQGASSMCNRTPWSSWQTVRLSISSLRIRRLGMTSRRRLVSRFELSL